MNAWSRAVRHARQVLLAACVGVLTACRPDTGTTAKVPASHDTAAAGAMPDMPGMPGMAVRANGSVQLSASTIAQFGITFDTAAVRALDGGLRTVGTIAVDEAGVVAVTTKVNGFVERLDARVTGQRVTRGQSLAGIYAPDVLAAQEELLVAQRLGATVDYPATGDSTPRLTLLSAARRRLRLLDVSDAQIDEVLRTQRVQRTTTLVAPISGVVTQRFVSQGQAAQAGMPLFTIADLTRLWVDVRIPAGAAAVAREGMQATYAVNGVPGRTYTGRVAYIYPTVGDQTRTLSARVLVRDTEGTLRPGMFATVTLASPGRRVLTVPRTAVIETGTRALVFVDMGGGQLMAHEVTLGATTAELAEIVSGISAGARVVTSAQYLLESESNLAEVMRGMVGMGNAAKGADQGMAGMPMGGAGTAPSTVPSSTRP